MNVAATQARRELHLSDTEKYPTGPENVVIQDRECVFGGLDQAHKRTRRFGHPFPKIPHQKPRAQASDDLSPKAIAHDGVRVVFSVKRRSLQRLPMLNFA